MVCLERMALRTTTRAVTDVINEDITQTGTALKKIKFNTQFPVLLTLTVRLKILKMIVSMFSSLNNNNYVDVIKQLPLLHKRISINTHQFSKLSNEKNKINIEYTKNSILIIYKYIHSLKKLGF